MIPTADDLDPAATLRIRLPVRDDRARLDAATAEIEDAVAAARTTTEEVQRVAADLDSDRISTEGVVLDPFLEEDTIVRHIRAARGSVAG